LQLRRFVHFVATALVNTSSLSFPFEQADPSDLRRQSQIAFLVERVLSLLRDEIARTPFIILVHQSMRVVD
jgi:hypothetical protein